VTLLCAHACDVTQGHCSRRANRPQLRKRVIENTKWTVSERQSADLPASSRSCARDDTRRLAQKKAIRWPLYAMSRPSIGSIHSPFLKGYQELADEELVEKNRASARFGRKRSDLFLRGKAEPQASSRSYAGSALICFSFLYETAMQCTRELSIPTGAENTYV
jgi:hypothetical protein